MKFGKVKYGSISTTHADKADRSCFHFPPSPAYVQPIFVNMTKQIQRRLAAILAADVVGFSRLMGVDEEGTLTNLRSIFTTTIEPAIARYAGRIFKTTGDGVLAEFASVVSAVKCAAEIQIALSTKSTHTPPERRIVFRIGINLGDIMVEGDDIYGDGVNIAARIESLCAPAGVSISASAHEQVRDKVEWHFVDCGDHAVKNIARPVRVFALDLSGHGIAGGVASPGMPAGKARREWRGAAVALAIVAAVAAGWLSLADSAKPVRAALTDLTRGKQPASTSRATIAVVPLVNQSGDAKRDYFSDGVTEDIIGALSRFSGLMVISHNSALVFKDRKATPAEISRELGVRYIVQGSVREANGKLRVAVELSDAEKGVQLWSEKYDGEGRDVFEIQDRIVRNIVGVLAVKITSIEASRTAAKPPESLEAYDMVLRARELILQTDRGANREARNLTAQAIRLAPKFAEAYVTQANAEWQRAELGWIEDAEEGVRRSEDLANQALALNDPGVQARAHARLGLIHSYRREYERALFEAEQATKANPNDADALGLRANVYLWQGRIDDAIMSFETARQFDPRLSSGGAITMSLAYYSANRYDEAVAVASSFMGRYPNVGFLHAVRAAALAQLGRMEEARAAAALARKANPSLQVESFGTRFRDVAYQAKIQDRKSVV